MDERLTPDEQQTLQKTLLRIHERGCGLAVGLLFGLVLFVSTNVLILRGGPVIGPHLGLLGVYFPGYRVSFLGSLVGFVYAFVIGYGAGRVIARTYNRLSAGRR